MDTTALHSFAIAAKKATYVGSGAPATPSRVGSHDLTFEQGPWVYRDSYFGGTDFLGQEVIWHETEPVWAMNYHGYILRADLITPTQAGTILKAALAQPQSQGRLLDTLDCPAELGHYRIASTGTISCFGGRETIHVGDVLAYALDYQGGVVIP